LGQGYVIKVDRASALVRSGLCRIDAVFELAASWPVKEAPRLPTGVRKTLDQVHVTELQNHTVVGRRLIVEATYPLT
jgi:hypothetical protein